MLSHPTLDQLKNLKLHGMARAFAELGGNAQAAELDHAQWLALLLDREQAERAGEPGFADAAGTDDDQVLLAGDPLASCQLLEEGFVEAPGGAVNGAEKP